MEYKNHIKRSEERDIILDSIADGVFTVDGEWKITSFNRAAEEITGIPRQEAIGRKCCDVFKASICEGSCALRHTLESGQQIVNKAVFIITAEGERIPISISTALLKGADGRTIGGVETFRDLSVVEDLRKEIGRKYTFADIISKNHKMQELFDIMPEIAESDSTVLLEGESGTGKELFARAIHSLSHRRKKPMITVNCGALPDTLLESELFGYKAGAFTDAKKDKPGRFALADSGTIFLDEIGDVSPALQVRLLRVLQERIYEPLGSTQSVSANVRVVTATNKDLTQLVASGRFRQDLYYRINVVKLSLPPLRKRMEDVPLLVDHLVARFNRLRGKEIAGVSPDTLAILMNHDFQGNVRELENIIEHAFVLCRGNMILPAHLPQYLRPELEKAIASPLDLNFREIEAQFIRNCLQRNNWNRTAAAHELGIHKTTLWRKMKRLGIDLPE
ncbi:MAG: PAS domain-containing protein [Candidatus Abyssobacteria bacterium SURF_5]|uniref:PAS domain-containing protein n=1 Tax=Abyssobacteria bacterium (strain SURF_5) TaxID=2093360 RepID=A0A3A4NVK5_ABYX5|nr:MAG: PAS domain-containing protein [Candidatus Abyssubacteria bacterium SURF_5]